MAVIRPCGCELAELVTDHILRDENGHELAPVVDGEREPDTIGDDGRTTGPGLDDLLAPCFMGMPHLPDEVVVDERSFFN
jgi:hypothetical protein